MQKKLLLITSVLLFALLETVAETPTGKALVLTERGGQHGSFTDAAMRWLDGNAKAMNLEFVEVNNTKAINDDFLRDFKLIIQLDYPPYTWSVEAERAFVRYIDEGRGGWIGFHHATLLGEFDGYPLWHWFSDFMGGIRFSNYIARKADGNVRVEDAQHPVMRGVSSSFVIPDDEWYTFDRNPRPNVHTLANVDEASYQPPSDILMGDHPVIWTNPFKAARNVYFLMGHSGKLFEVKDFTAMFSNAIAWTAETAAEARNFYAGNYASKPRFKALVYYSEHVEDAHVKFARQAVEFFRKLNYGNGFILETATDLSSYSLERLMEYDVVVMLNDAPHGAAQREAFEKYMENGGGWMGFHAAAYNDRNTGWPWLVNFLGGGVFDCNNWPPQAVKLTIDNPGHPVTKNLPPSFTAPESEWYMWKPNPRNNPDVEVLLTISPDNYPLGIKDVIAYGDFPVVWTNRKYRMIYLNMGHGDDEFTDATQKLLFTNAFRWVVSRNTKGNPFNKRYR
jgi:type 1 glutamine amidotransferase